MWRRLLAIRLQEKAGGDGGAGDGGGGGTPPAGGQPPAGQPGAAPGGAPAGGKETILGSAKPAEGQQPPNGGKPGDGAPPPWKWADNVDGTGTVPPWFKADKYKTIEAQARATPELEAKLGKAAELIGAPEGGVYKLPEVKLQQGEGKEPVGWVWDEKSPMLQAFNKVAGELGLSQKAYDQISSVVAMAMAGQQEAEELALSEALAQLGNNVEQRVKAVSTFLNTALPAELAQALDQSIGTSPQAFAAVEKLVAKLSGDAQLANNGGNPGPAFTRADIQAEQFKVYPDGHAMAGKRMYDHDAAHRERVDKMWKELFPGEDITHVG